MESKEPRDRELDDIGSYIRSRGLTGLTVQDVLRNKGGGVLTVLPETSLQEALEHMSRHDVGALVVTENNNVVGIISERDFARESAAKISDPKRHRVRELMKSPVQTAGPEDGVAECMSLMTAGHVRHLPVLADDRLVGIVSIGDLVNACIKNQDRLLEKYREYIRGD